MPSLKRLLDADIAGWRNEQAALEQLRKERRATTAANVGYSQFYLQAIEAFREVELRRVVDAILYILSAGYAWTLLPKEFAPVSTVQGYFYRWRDDGTWERINQALLMAAREAMGREASPLGRGDRQPVGRDDRGRRPARV